MGGNIEPDITAELIFYPTEKGGRRSPISLKRFGCIFVYESENFDSFVLLSEGQQVSPGDRTVLPIKFLRAELIKPRLREGDAFHLRELETIAEGKILKIFSDSTT